MKRIVAITLTLILLCTMTLTAFAADTGSITVTNPITDVDYEIYQLLDLQAYSGDNYFYSVNSAWADFFATAEAQAYVSVDTESGHVEWLRNTDTDVAAFAQMALTYAEANGISPVKSSKNEGEFVITEGKGVFSNLPLGYYLVDSSVGVLCSLTTTDPDGEVNEKNTVPTVDKETEDSSAAIGDIVDFKVTITVGAGAEKYVLHDKMTDGLTFVHDVNNGRGVLSVTLAGDALAEGTDYTVKTTGFAEGHVCTFEVIFTETGMAKMDDGEKLIVSYNAQVNEKAIVNSAKNEAHLEYGDEITAETTTDSTETKTYSIDLVKTDGDNKLLNGAQFKIYDAATDGNEIKVVKMEDGNYRLAMPGETGVAIEVTDGKVTVFGFAAGTYYLEETVAPAGYNKLTTRKAFTITDSDLNATINEGVYTPETGVQVVNKTGSMLPETGAAGTVAFIAIGAVVVLVAGVLLVTKKRMSMVQE